METKVDWCTNNIMKSFKFWYQNAAISRSSGINGVTRNFRAGEFQVFVWKNSGERRFLGQLRAVRYYKVPNSEIFKSSKVWTNSCFYVLKNNHFIKAYGLWYDKGIVPIYFSFTQNFKLYAFTYINN